MFLVCGDTHEGGVGRLISKKTIAENSHQFIINTSGYLPGIYHYKLVAGSTMIGQGKLGVIK